MLTEQEANDMHVMVTEMEDRGLAADLFTLGRLAETTGDEWEQLVRECLSQWRPLAEAYEPPAGTCPAPINGKAAVKECIEAGYCGCDNRDQSQLTEQR